MAALKDEVKLFIVQRLAMFDSQVDIVDAVKETFGVVVSRQQVYFYDPTTGTKPAKKWCIEFRRMRRRFLKRTTDIAIANKSVRLARLDRMQQLTERRSNFKLSSEILKQAAEEMGDVYTNKRELTGKDGSPLLPANPLDDLSDEELATLAAVLTEKDRVS